MMSLGENSTRDYITILSKSIPTLWLYLLFLQNFHTIHLKNSLTIHLWRERILTKHLINLTIHLWMKRIPTSSQNNHTIHKWMKRIPTSCQNYHTIHQWMEGIPMDSQSNHIIHMEMENVQARILTNLTFHQINPIHQLTRNHIILHDKRYKSMTCFGVNVVVVNPLGIWWNCQVKLLDTMLKK